MRPDPRPPVSGTLADSGQSRIDSARDDGRPKTGRSARVRRRRRALATGTAIVVVAAVVSTVVLTREHRHTGPGPLPVDAIDVGRAGFDWPGSVWDARIGGAPLAAGSAAMVAELASQVGGKDHYPAAFNVWTYNTSIITAGPDQKRVDVAFDNCQKKSYTPQGLLGSGGQFTAVPLPADAAPAAGTDGELTVYSPSADTLWEFWKLHRVGSGWAACWGGRLDHVSRSPGYFTNGFGASASGLAIIGGAVDIAEARAGRIDHALALAIPTPAPWKEVVWPAQRSDGSPGSTSNIPEGTRFRLDPSIDVSTLNLSPLAKMIAVAAQKYGFIVTDKAGAVSVIAQSGSAAQAQLGTNPWKSLLAGVPSFKVLDGFPWQDLQAVQPGFDKAAVAR